ncbi:MAG: hypothetical protein F4Y86_07545 [Gammaproteobacteria bacterium]|nr:hypothetical protein [Gammaproteobacteria bacterium]
MPATDTCPECGQRFSDPLYSLTTGEPVNPHECEGKIIVCNCGVLLAVAGFDADDRRFLRVATEGDLEAQSINDRRRFKVASRVIPQASDGLTAMQLHALITDAFDDAGI